MERIVILLTVLLSNLFLPQENLKFPGSNAYGFENCRDKSESSDRFIDTCQDSVFKVESTICSEISFPILVFNNFKPNSSNPFAKSTGNGKEISKFSAD